MYLFPKIYIINLLTEIGRNTKYTIGLMLLHCLLGICHIIGITNNLNIGRSIYLANKFTAQKRMVFVNNDNRNFMFSNALFWSLFKIEASR